MKTKGKIKDIYPLTPMQEGMLFHTLYEKNSPPYFVQTSYRLHGELNISYVKRSLNDLIRRYDILRTVFIYEGRERPLQVVLKEREIDFYFEDIRKIVGKNLQKIDAFVEQSKKKDRQRSFDLSKDALMRVSILLLEESEYEFTWSFHHILMDGWCTGILVREFFDIYNSYLENIPYRLPGAKQFKTYIEWLEKQDKNEGKNYWKKYLEKYEKPATIPFKLFNTRDIRYELENTFLILDGKKTYALKELAVRNQVTLNTLIQVIWGIILGKYNNKNDVVYGGVVSGRPSQLEGIESMIGLFINTIPVRIRWEEKTKINELLQRVQEEAINSEPYHHYPLVEIQAESALKRNLFDHIITFENYPVAKQLVGNSIDNRQRKKLVLANVESLVQTNYDLNLTIVPAEQLTIIFNYNAKVYEHCVIEKIARHFEELIIRVLENPGLDVIAAGKVTGERKEELLFQMNQRLKNDMETIKNKGCIFQERLNESLSQFGDKIAVEYGGIFITYTELDRRSSHIATRIIAKGIKKETFVGILIDDRMEFITAMIAILKAGCAFVPLDSAHPRARMQLIINRTDLRFVVCNKGCFTKFTADNVAVNEKHPVEFILIDVLFPAKNLSYSIATPDVQYDPEDKIYIYFTSGTTGEPKAIVGKNKSLLQFINWEIDTFKINEYFRFSQFSTPMFDAFLKDVFVSICSGGVICIPINKDIILSPGELIHWVDKHRLNLIHCVPSFFRFLNTGNLNRDSFKQLRFILLSGEPTYPSDLTKWYDIFGDRVQLVNFYGPTETTIIKSFYMIRKSDVYRERVPIGKAMEGCQFIVCDVNMDICDDLITGEIYIRTPYRTFGYYGDHELNLKHFIQNPFTDDPDDVLYKTGDLGRVLPDGNFEFIGRIDRQVKIRGIRIELEEIENVAIKNPMVKEAAVVKKEISTDKVLLCLYITESEQRQGDEAAFIASLREYLSERLEGYMVPSQIVKLREIPRKPNGKVDYEALLYCSESEALEYIQPRNNIEQKLLMLWRDVLQCEEIGVTVNFFELGGNSLNVLSLLSRIRKEFDVRISLREVFNNPTIELQAEIVKNAGKERFKSIEATESKEYYALSSAQKRLYILQHMDKASIAYNNLHIRILEGDIDLQKLEDTFRKLITRHEILRTSFKLINDEPVQKVDQGVEFGIRHYTPGGEDVEKIMKNFLRVFDLSKAPLVRVGVIKENEKRVIVMFDMHHIISDGVSFSIFLKDFMALYEGQKLADLKFQYKDFSQWQNSEKEKEVIKRQKAFWLKQFDGEIPSLKLLGDFAGPKIQSFEGDEVLFDLDAEKTGALKELVLKEDVTLYMVLLAIYSIFLSKICNQQDLVIGTPVAGRSHVDLQQIMGMFVNTLAVRLYPRGELTFTDYLKDVKETTLAVFENQDYQIEDLVENVVGRRDASRNPLFDVMFTLQNIPISGFEIKGLKLELYQYKRKISKIDMQLICSENENNLYCIFEYCTNRFRRESIKVFIDYFHTIVSCVIDNPEIPLSAIQVGAREEMRLIEEQFTDDLENESY